MNFQNIEYFLAVTEYMNFSKAAKSLYISQQSLSENIKRLEEEVGTPLFIRGKTLSLTPAGECFLHGGQKILKTQDKMLREISILSNTTRCKIVVGVSTYDIPPFLPQVLGSFSKKYPEYEVVLQTERSNDIPDLSFYEDSLIPKSMECIPLINKDPFVVVCNKLLVEQHLGSDYPSCLDTLTEGCYLSDLKVLPFLGLVNGKHLHPFYERLLEETVEEPKWAFKSDDANLLTSLCINGTGAFIGPLDYCKRKFGPLIDASSGTLLMFPLQSKLFVSLSLIYPVGKRLNQAEKRFVEEIRLTL